MARDYKLPFLAARDNGTGGRWLSLLSEREFACDSIIIVPATTPAEDWLGFYSRAVKALRPGLHQMYVHLAFDDEEYRAIAVDHTAYGPAWRQRDFNVVTSPEFKAVIQENHIILVSWKDLKKVM